MKRLGTVLKWIAIAAGSALAILLIVIASYNWSTGTRLERRLAALRKAGEPVQVADLARPPIPPERNADVFLRRAADDLKAVQGELVAWYPKTGSPTGTLSPADRRRLESLFAAYPKVWPLVEQAAACPDDVPTLDGSMPPTRFMESCMEHSSLHRLVARVMRARSTLLLANGRNDEALAAQVLVLRLTRCWRREPLLIGYLVTVACESVAMDGVNQVLQGGPVSPSARQALDAELALHDSMDEFRWGLRSERAYSLSAVREFPGSRFWLTRGFANDLMLQLLGLYDRHLSDASRPFAAVVARKGAAARARGELNPYGALVVLLEPALVTAREPAERVRAQSRSLRVLNALQVRAPLGGGRVPDLAALGLPAGATVDPFSGGALRVKERPQGWVVYSVGSNGVDDGGTLDGRADLGFGPVVPEGPRKTP